MGYRQGTVCLKVLSAVSCLHRLPCVESSVNGYCSIGISWCSVSKCRQYVAQMFRLHVEKHDERSPTQYWKAFNVLLVCISTHHQLGVRMSVCTFFVGGVVHPLVLGLHLCRQWSAVDATCGLLQCVTTGNEWKKGKEGGGTKCSSVHKTPRTLPMSPRILCENEEMRSGWCISPTSSW